MSIQLTWYGHATWGVEVDGVRLLVDPFFNQNPASSCRAESVTADYIFITHGHGDHTADAADIANRCGATLVANFEIANWFAAKHSVAKTLGMNTGGTAKFPFGTVQMTIAFHSSSLPDGTYGGNPGGYLMQLGERRIYFAGDTALFGDMKLYGEPGLDAAVLPIGDFYTMGPHDSIAAIKLLGCRRVFCSHVNTWPPIAQDTSRWSEQVRAETSAEPIVLQPGQSYAW